MKIYSRVIRPLLIGKLVKYFTPGQTELTKTDAYMYAVIFIVITITHTLYLHGYMFVIEQLGLKIRVSISSLIYRKSLKLSPESLLTITNGKVVTLVSKDVYSFHSAIMFAHDIWVGTIQIMIMSYVMYKYIGWAALTGIAFLLIMVPIQRELSMQL